MNGVTYMRGTKLRYIIGTVIIALSIWNKRDKWVTGASIVEFIGEGIVNFLVEYC